MHKKNHRLQRIARQITKELSELLQFEVSDPRIHSILLSDLEVATDLSLAKIFYTVTDKKIAVDELQEVLQKATGFLRNQLAKRLLLRVTPELRFVYDESVAKGQHLTHLIEQAVASDKKLKQMDQG